VLIPADGKSQPARAARNTAIALNTFLDWNPSPNLPQKAVQQPGPRLQVVDAGSSGSADRDAGVEGLLSEPSFETLEAPSSEEQGPEVLAPSRHADGVPAGVASESGPESADERAVGNERVETRDGGGWTNLMKVLVVVSISALWTCLARHPRWSQ
jgi:hypothetical protein